MNTMPASTTSSLPATAPLAASSTLLPLLAAAALGLVVLYAVGFAPSALAHNAAHDVRHIAGTPCH